MYGHAWHYTNEYFEHLMVEATLRPQHRRWARVMLGKSRPRFWRRPVLALAAAASDPREALAAFQDRNVERRERPTPPDLYTAEDNWEHRLHSLLGHPFPCEASAEFWALWP